MPTLTYPGVYIEEVSSGVRPIAAASTSTAAFVGLAQRGPDDPTLITNWTEYQRTYGSYFPDSYLAQSVFEFFNNGGRQCYVVRVMLSNADTADVTVSNRASTPVPGVKFLAKNKGAWGNSLVLQIEDGTLDPGNEFKVSVRLQADPAVVPTNVTGITPVEVLDNLSIDPAAPNYVSSVLAQNSALIDAQVLPGNISVQSGVHRGGFGPSLPLQGNLSFRINVDGDGYQTVTLPTATGASTSLATVATAIQTAVSALTANKASTAPAAFTGFTCTVETISGQSRLALTSGTTAATSSVQVQPAPAGDATYALKLGTGNGGRSEGGLAVRRPANADVVQVGDAAVTPPVTAHTPGTEGTGQLSEDTFASAFPLLNNKTDFSLLAVPGESSSVMFDKGTQYCANRPLQDVFYIGEMAKDDDTVAEAEIFRSNLTSANSYGALYFPWVKALDPTIQSQQPTLLPPSGYIAGLYARIDASRGVWKAPAGTEASLSGVVGLATELSDVEHGNLNPIGVDVIRRFAGSGVVAFGARTISSDPEWNYTSRSAGPPSCCGSASTTASSGRFSSRTTSRSGRSSGSTSARS